MDELYAFLFASLFILLMLFVFFGYHQPYTPLKVVEPENITNITNISEGLNWKTIYLGDITISKKEFEKKETIANEVEVSNGLFYGERDFKIKYEVENEILNNLVDAELSYYIKDTNNYGDLEVKFNNITLDYGKLIAGKYRYKVNPNNENIIEFKTTSSGWKIWAPSMYLISNLSMNLKYVTKEYPSYKFYVSNFIHKNLYKSEILFNFVSAEDKILIILNNETIYEGIPKVKVNSIEFFNLKEGYNNILFISNATAKLENVRVRLYYYT
jgi:hypothetical protein